jgi:hypothetical protein
MKGNRLVKVYDRLTPQERFVLAVTADARGDETERRELMRTCPRYCYTMTDADFMQRIETSQMLAVAVLCDTQKMLGWLDLLELLIPLLDAEEPGSDTYMAGRVCATAALVAATRVKAVAEAFGDACREHLGIEASVLLRAHGVPLEERLAGYADALATVERDEDLYSEYRETVAAVWAKALAPAEAP